MDKPPEDPEKRRIRQMAEMSGSLAPSRLGAWVTPGTQLGESWSDLPWVGRVAVVIIVVTCLAGFGLMVGAIFLAGQTDAGVFMVALAVLFVGAVIVGRVRRRRAERTRERDQTSPG